ncbi:conjugal transfer protein TraG N-terminal domain-containing protein [Vibrio artabrorum]|uniref:conjugal transfer protein TraG N-terminal domain-containing protein n=1 Tax=Vibrio artabrorum TaxID=446374 RepID=UPI00354ADF75
MITQDLLNLTLLSQGWYIANRLWHLINDSGFTVFIFLLIVVNVWFEALQEGADEGNKATLAMNRVVAQWISAGLVLILGVIPVIPISMSTLTFNQDASQQCGAYITKGSSNPNHTLVDGQVIQTPILWALMHALAQGFNTAMVSALPCEGDITRTVLDLDNAHITSPILKQEVQMFYEQCYTRAKLALNTAGREGKVEEEAFDTANWIAGKTFFQARPNAPFSSYTTLQTREPVFDFPFNAERDTPKQTQYNKNADIDKRRTYPMCDEWWQTREKDPRTITKPAGLKFRLYVDLAHHYPGVTEDIIHNRGVFERLIFGETTREDRLDMYLERVLSPSNQKNRGAISKGYGQRIDGNLAANTIGAVNIVAGTASLAVGQALAGPIFFIVRESLPMIQAILMAVLVIAAPIVSLIGLFRAGVLMSLLITYFGLVTLTFWWDLGMWMESNLLESIYKAHATVNPISQLTSNIITMTSNVIDDGILSMTLMVYYVAITSVWLGLLGYAGYKTSAVSVGSFINDIEQTTTKGSDAIQGALKKKQ